MKIMIIGYSGSGKSTLARAFAQKYGCEALYLDTVNFLPNWVERTKEEKQRIVQEFLDTHDAWVIDGNYTKCSYERRMEEADLIVEMLLPPLTCLFRVYKRLFQYRGRTRPDMTEGCKEKVDWKFIKWVLWEGRTAKAQQRYTDIAVKYPKKTRIARSQRQLSKLYADFGIQ